MIDSGTLTKKSSGILKKESSRLIKRFSLFNFFNVAFMVVLSALTIYPFWYVLMASLASDSIASEAVFFLYPVGPTLAAYRMVFSTNAIVTAYRNTLFVTIVGTSLSLLVTALLAYPLSRERLIGGKVIRFLIYFSMIFSGGLVPTFLVVRGLGLLNTLWALILPSMVTVWNTMLMIAFFRGLSVSLEESAQLEGANDLRILFSIVFPISKPIFATMTLFYGVMYWNAWFNALIYITRRDLFPIQLLLREIVQMVDLTFVAGGGGDLTMTDLTMQSVRMATIIVAIVPIICVYPFLQKYFVKGVMVGAVKE